MTRPCPPLVQYDPWERLRAATSARIALGRVGASLPSAEILRFGLAHARARDAVHHPMDADALRHRLAAAGFTSLNARSQARDRHVYLLRPDLGRRLEDDSRLTLEAQAAAPELAIVIADGLSSFAVERHALPLLECFRDAYETDWPRTPVVVVQQGRVAIGDDVGEALRAKLVIVLIGERPGLTSPDSLGIYFTYRPRRGLRDSSRNCISNVRPEGLPCPQAAAKLNYLVRQAMHLQLSGVMLKDDSDALAVDDGATGLNTPTAPASAASRPCAGA